MLLLLFQQRSQLRLDFLQLFQGREAIHAQGFDACLHLGLQGRHAHHEEFIEVVAEDGAELGLFQQWGALILGLGQHPLVEVDPGQFSV